jgi:hypothetical protein
MTVMKHMIFNMTWPGFIWLCALMGASCGGMDVAHADSIARQGAPTAPKSVGEVAGWGATVSSSHLATVRGGFDAGSGLLVSFGIERAVYVNGNLVTSTSLYIPNIGQMSAAQASALAAMVGTINVIQNGPGDGLDSAAFAQTTAATVVQNTLNNQRIQTLTTIDTTVNTLEMFRSLNLQSTLQSALINSLGH